VAAAELVQADRLGDPGRGVVGGVVVVEDGPALGQHRPGGGGGHRLGQAAATGRLAGADGDLAEPVVVALEDRGRQHPAVVVEDDPGLSGEVADDPLREPWVARVEHRDFG